MADADADLPCRFRWRIINLFEPDKELKATFYSGSPTIKQWQIALRPQSRRLNRCPFSFSLRNFKLGERADTAAAEVRVSVSVNGSIVETRLERNYSFSAANEYAFEFSGNLIIPTAEVSYDATIEVQISLPTQGIANQRSEFRPRECDLMQLSEDLMNLLESLVLYDLEVMVRRPIVGIGRLHSCIIRARWSNFFSVHPVQTIIDGTVVVNVSFSILRALIIYLYSGTLDTIGPILEDMSLKTELFHVINGYQMYHLYKVFTVDDSRQARRTTKNLRTFVENFRLDGQPLNNQPIPFTWTVSLEANYTLTFHIRFFISDDGSWIYYYMRSDYPRTLSVHVRLEFEIRHGENRSTFYTVHGHDHTIDSAEDIECEVRRFEGNVRRVNEFLDSIRRCGRRSRRIEHYIRCSLYTTDGTAVIEVQREGDAQMQSLGDRLNVLSDHMHEMLQEAVEPDLEITCPVERPEDPDFPCKTFRLHKPIFIARVPQWTAVLEDVQQGDDVPDKATCTMYSEAFRLFVTYMYSGNLLPIPGRYLQELEDFAERGRLKYLSSFIDARRTAYQDL